MSLNHLNIAIIGPEGVGKSTLVNTLFKRRYSTIKIQKNTFVPQYYSENDDFKEVEKDIDNIRNLNNSCNNIDLSNANSKLDPIIHQVPSLDDINFKYPLQVIDLPDIYDIVKNVDYFSSLVENVSLFILVIDINMCHNSSYDNILYILLSEISQWSDKEFRLMILINKCDDMIVSDEELTFSEEEHSEIFQNFIETTKNRLGNLENLKWDISPVSLKLAFLYRLVERIGIKNLDLKDINQLQIHQTLIKIKNKLPLETKHHNISCDTIQTNNTMMFTTGITFVIDKINNLIDQKLLIRYLKDQAVNEINRYLNLVENNENYQPEILECREIIEGSYRYKRLNLLKEIFPKNVGKTYIEELTKEGYQDEDEKIIDLSNWYRFSIKSFYLQKINYESLVGNKDLIDSLEFITHLKQTINNSNHGIFNEMIQLVIIDRIGVIVDYYKQGINFELLRNPDIHSGIIKFNNLVSQLGEVLIDQDKLIDIVKFSIENILGEIKNCHDPNFFYTSKNSIILLIENLNIIGIKDYLLVELLEYHIESLNLYLVNTESSNTLYHIILEIFLTKLDFNQYTESQKLFLNKILVKTKILNYCHKDSLSILNHNNEIDYKTYSSDNMVIWNYLLDLYKKIYNSSDFNI